MTEQPETTENDPQDEPVAVTADEQDHTDPAAFTGDEADAPTGEVTE